MYESEDKFPHMPSKIIKMDVVSSVMELTERKWYFQSNFYYLQASMTNSDQ